MIEMKLSSIYKILEYKYFVLLLSILFSLDILYLIIYNKNIIDVLITDNNINKGFNLLLFAIYMFIMVLLFPALRYIIRWFYTYFQIKIDDYDDKDYKYLFSVKREAIAKENIFLLSLVEKEEIKNKEVEKDLNIDFSLGLLIFIDYIFYENGLFNIVCSYIQNMTGLLYFICSFVGTLFIFVVLLWFWVSLFPYKIEKIYLPDKELVN